MALFLAMVLAGFGFAALADETFLLVGSGSNVPNPLYSVWVDEFNKRDPKVQVRYLPIGTSESIKEISRGTGDFGGGEIPMTDEQLGEAKSKILQIPTVLVSIVPIYNVPGAPAELRFTGEVLAKIFLGTIKNWNDPRITKLNPDAALPDLPISIVHRSDGKGSNYIFTDYLSKVSAEWKSQIGRSPSPKWPLGQSANRGEDMMDKVKGAPGAIGYNELGYANRGGVGIGSVQNAAGQFIKASPETIAAAWHSVAKSAPADLRVSMTNAPGKDSYPISSFTWLYVPAQGSSAARTHALKSFLTWALTDGQRTAQAHGYEPLPRPLAEKVLERLGELP